MLFTAILAPVCDTSDEIAFKLRTDENLPRQSHVEASIAVRRGDRKHKYGKAATGYHSTNCSPNVHNVVVA
jgi:hypothetical protein